MSIRSQMKQSIAPKVKKAAKATHARCERCNRKIAIHSSAHMPAHQKSERCRDEYAYRQALEAGFVEADWELLDDHMKTLEAAQVPKTVLQQGRRRSTLVLIPAYAKRLLECDQYINSNFVVAAALRLLTVDAAKRDAFLTVAELSKGDGGTARVRFIQALFRKTGT